MKRQALFTVLTAASAAALAALASPAAGKGKPPTTGADCKPQVSVVVRGTAAADGNSTLSLNVSGGNHWAKLLFANKTTTTTTITASGSTRVTIAGKPGSLGSIKKDDRVLARYRVCKADLRGKTTSSASDPASFLGSHAALRVIDLGTKPRAKTTDAATIRIQGKHPVCFLRSSGSPVSGSGLLSSFSWVSRSHLTLLPRGNGPVAAG
jgi:hypothetical protein